MATRREGWSRRLFLRIVLVAAAASMGALMGRTLRGRILDAYWTMILKAPPVAQAPRRAPDTLPEPEGLATSPVVIVDVSRGKEAGTGIVDRAILARVVRQAAALGAWAIGLDVFLDAPASAAAADDALALAIRDARRVVLATWYSETTLRQVIPHLADAACALGETNLPLDEDGGLRRVIHHFDEASFRGRESMALALVSLVVNYPEVRPGRVEVGPDALDVVGHGMKLQIPVDAQGTSLIQYLGVGGTLPVVRWDKLLMLDRQSLDLEAKVVLIGDARLDTRDAYLTPFHRASKGTIAGVEVIGQDVAGILTGLHQRIASTGTERVAIVVGALCGLALALILPTRWAAVATVLAMLATCGASMLLFARQGLLIEPVGPVVGLLVALAGEKVSALARRLLVPRDEELEQIGVAVEEGMELLSAGRKTASVAHLQGLLSRSGGRIPDTLRLALARALLVAGQIEPALEHATRIEGTEVPLEDLYELATSLEDNGAHQEASALYSKISAREVAFRDVAQRVAVLAVQGRDVPPALRRALLGKYRDIALVGSGGMGSVYRAWDRKAARPVALKVPGEELIAQPDARRRFIREAQLLASITHPHVVRLYDVSDDTIPYYAMELISGHDLAHLLDREGHLDAPRTLMILAPIASALAAVHARGIVHRDIKPQNVLLDDTGTPRLSDFGLAFVANSTRLTKTSAVIGTPIYIAPEQLRGEDPTTAVDVYAFGVMLFVMLSGEPPFPQTQVYRKVTEEAPSIRTAVPMLAEELAGLVDACLAREPARRPKDGRMLFERIRAVVMAGGPPQAQRLVEALASTVPGG